MELGLSQLPVLLAIAANWMTTVSTKPPADSSRGCLDETSHSSSVALVPGWRQELRASPKGASFSYVGLRGTCPNCSHRVSQKLRRSLFLARGFSHFFT